MKWFPWILGMLVIGVGTVGAYSGTDLYAIFPVLGVWAWSIMWTHYMVGELRRLYPSIPFNKGYHTVSSSIVLTLLILHPGLLALAQFQNHMGLPPGSFYRYVDPHVMYAITLAECAWLGFMSFEIVVRLKNKPSIRDHWWIVNLVQSIAMVFIFIHSLTVGRSLQEGWFRSYWIVLGIILTISIIHLHAIDISRFISSSQTSGKDDRR